MDFSEAFSFHSLQPLLSLCTLLVTKEFYDDTFYVSFTTINCTFNRVYVNAFAIEVAIGQMKTNPSVLFLLAETTVFTLVLMYYFLFISSRLVSPPVFEYTFYVQLATAYGNKICWNHHAAAH